MNRTMYTFIYYDFELMQSFIKFQKEKADDGFECYKCRWAYIKHDKDMGIDGLKKEHYHLVVEYFEPFRSDRLWQSCKQYFEHGSLEDINKADTRAWSYLIHANTPDKYQYEFADIVHSDNFQKDDLFDKVEKYRRLTTNQKNSVSVLALMNFIAFHRDDIYDLQTLFLLLAHNEEMDLLGYCTKNVYLCLQLLPKNSGEYNA